MRGMLPCFCAPQPVEVGHAVHLAPLVHGEALGADGPAAAGAGEAAGVVAFTQGTHDALRNQPPALGAFLQRGLGFGGEHASSHPEGLHLPPPAAGAGRPEGGRVPGSRRRTWGVRLFGSSAARPGAGGTSGR